MTVVGAIRRGGEGAPGLSGAHPAMVALRDAIRRAAALPAPTLVWGPTGSGKEVVARAIHEASVACAKPFLPINVTALPEGLVDSELFGCVRGAFTGAVNDRLGLFEAAQGGTVFLDEAADLAPSIQLKLLRVLEYGEVRRVGATTSTHVDFRLVVATQEDPRALTAARRWREDFYYRLAGIALRVPELREHRSDIPELIRAFLSQGDLQGIERQAVDLLVRWTWPGNVRELQQTLLSAAFFADGGILTLEHARQALASSASCRSGMLRGDDGSPDSAQAVELLAACAAHAWDLRRAAPALGVSSATLYRRLRALGVVPRQERLRQQLAR